MDSKADGSVAFSGGEEGQIQDDASERSRCSAQPVPPPCRRPATFIRTVKLREKRQRLSAAVHISLSVHSAQQNEASLGSAPVPPRSSGPGSVCRHWLRSLSTYLRNSTVISPNGILLTSHAPNLSPQFVILLLVFCVLWIAETCESHMFFRFVLTT